MSKVFVRTLVGVGICSLFALTSVGCGGGGGGLENVSIDKEKKTSELTEDERTTLYKAITDDLNSQKEGVCKMAAVIGSMMAGATGKDPKEVCQQSLKSCNEQKPDETKGVASLKESLSSCNAKFGDYLDCLVARSDATKKTLSTLSKYSCDSLPGPADMSTVMSAQGGSPEACKKIEEECPAAKGGK